MRLYEILKENKLDPLYFTVDRKTRLITNFYGTFDPTMDIKTRQKYEDAVRRDLEATINFQTTEYHMYHPFHGKLEIGDKVDFKGNKVKQKPKNENLIQDLLQEYAIEKFGFQDEEEAGEAIDVYHENFVTPSGIPVYFVNYDLDTIYAGKLPGNKITPIVDIFSDGEGSEETEKQWDGAIYRIEQSAQQFNEEVPTLYKIVGDRYSNNGRSGWTKIAQHQDPNVLLGLLLDIVWKQMKSSKFGK